MGQNALSGMEAHDAANAQSITVSDFLDQLPAGIQVLHDAGDAPLRWVEPSDLVDPTPYLMDHELLLTTGVPLQGAASSDQHMESYVHRLVEAKVSALGFGLEPHFDAIPPALLAACIRQGLTLWQIPPELPFAALGLSFARLLESKNTSRLRELTEANRSLQRAALSANPESEILNVLARRLAAQTLLFGPRGGLRVTAPQNAHSQLPAELLAEIVWATLSGAGPRLEIRELDSGHLLAFPLRGGNSARRGTIPSVAASDSTLGVLLVHCAQVLDAAEHGAVSTALGLLEIVSRQRSEGALAPTQLATALLVGFQADRAKVDIGSLFKASAGGTSRAPIRVIVGARAEGPPVDPHANTTALLRWRRELDSDLVLHTDEHLVAICRLPVTDSMLERFEREGEFLAVSEEIPAETLTSPLDQQSLQRQLQQEYAQALSLLPRVLDERRSLRPQDLPKSFAGLLPPEAAGTLARELLAPLLNLAEPRRTLLLTVLRGWLASNGSWDASATLLNLHRNSVRRYIGSITELLELNLNDAQTRAELWLALNLVQDSAD